MKPTVIRVIQFFDAEDKMVLETFCFSPFNHLMKLLAREGFSVFVFSFTSAQNKDFCVLLTFFSSRWSELPDNQDHTFAHRIRIIEGLFYIKILNHCGR